MFGAVFARRTQVLRLESRPWPILILWGFLVERICERIPDTWARQSVRQCFATQLLVHPN